MKENNIYAKFWDRAAAYLLDTVILGIFSFVLNYLNFTVFKSFLIYLPVALLAILYKPYLESTHAATFGKMLMKLQVVDVFGERISFMRALRRSMIYIVPMLIVIPVYFFIFRNPAVIQADDVMVAMAINYPVLQNTANLTFFITLVDVVVLLVDRKRSLHDLIGQTYVVKKDHLEVTSLGIQIEDDSM